MEIKFTISRNDRKNLAIAIGDILGCSPTYLGAPTFVYKFDAYTLDRNNCLIGDDTVDQTLTEKLLNDLSKQGYSYDRPDRLIIEIPSDGFSESALSNLIKLIESKASLLKKALRTECLEIQQTEDRLLFPWFDFSAFPDDVKAYSQFIAVLCAMAKALNRVNALPKDVRNDKYTFRCFLLRLGFIGTEYKTTRKILLSNLSGNSSYQRKAKDDIE